MEFTTIRVSDPVADELADRKGRGDSYDDVLRRVLGMDSTPAGVDVPAEPPAGGERDVLADVSFPSTKERADCEQAVYAARDYIREHAGATQREIVANVMPDIPLGYDVPELQSGDRFRGAWWRRIVKPGLEALDDVEKPPRGGSEWTYTG